MFRLSTTILQQHLKKNVKFQVVRNFALYNEDKFTKNPIERIFGVPTANAKQLALEKKAKIIEKYKTHESDTGSPAVQIAALSEKIVYLAKHFASHRKDAAGMRGFRSLLNRRKRILAYLRRTDVKTYDHIVGDLYKRATRKAARVERMKKTAQQSFEESASAQQKQAELKATKLQEKAERQAARAAYRAANKNAKKTKKTAKK